jgi:hypothetical protein
MVATSRTVVMESVNLIEPNQPLDKTDLPALDQDAFIEPLY